MTTQRRLRRVSIVAACSIVLTGAVMVMNGIGGATTHPSPPKSGAFGLQPHGVNFVIESGLDTTACLQWNLSSSGTIILELETCVFAQDAQRWFFAQEADGSSIILDTNGLCIDAPGFQVGNRPTDVPCTFKKGSERFVYSATSGQFTNESGTRCLTVTTASPGSPVYIDKCGSSRGQTWALGH